MDVLKKEKWKEYKARAKSGDAEAQWHVGYYYHNGAEDDAGKKLVKPDLQQAHKWYERAAEQGYAAAQNALASLLADGEDFPVDFPTAIRWYKKAIAQGEASAAYNLGITYRDMGKPALAYRWYARAAEMGEKDAYLQMGLCSLFGFGAKQDFKEARTCFARVAKGTPYKDVTQRTVEDAHYWMAVMGLAGMGKRESVSRVRKLFEIADEDGDHEQANDLLGVIGRAERIKRARKSLHKVK